MNTKFLSIAATGVLALGLTGCGGGSGESSDGGSSSTAAQSSNQPKPVAEVADLSGGTTTKVTLDAGFVKALGDLKLTPAPVGDGTISKAGVATFPITGGNVKYFKPDGPVQPFVQGRIDHDGSGLSLTAEGGPKVELEDFKIDPGASVLTGKVIVDGKTAAGSAPLFFLDGSTLKPLRTNDDGSSAVLEGTTVELKQEAADLLNDTFKTDALEGGLKIGVAKITVKTGAGS